MLLLELFWSFFKIGLFTIGGGYASLPLIENEIVNAKAWITVQEYTDIITISQISPGPIAINSATFVGTKVGGFIGAVIATLGVVAPSVIIALILARMYYKYRSVDTMQGVLAGLRPAVVALIASAGAALLVTALFQTGGFQIAGFEVNVIAVIMLIIALFALRKYKVDAMLVIFICGVSAILLSFLGIM
ncbi:chromate transporter [Jeotgalibaca porci]|uniref:Chromate transporter n=1 Tax=Jeotgalibaca porci TaxID=1868793 RepID=A0A6G7WJM9_9LACT|nr:chromate transporter [Jeotgalibaca porci]QIK52439.1 chromate transporter [Jeotgalibaca porci]